MHHVFAVVDWTGELPIGTIVQRMAADACVTDDDAPSVLLDHSPRICVAGAGGVATQLPSGSERLDLVLHGRLCGAPSKLRIADPARLEEPGSPIILDLTRVGNVALFASWRVAWSLSGDLISRASRRRDRSGSAA